MKRIPASQKIRKELEELLKGVNKKGFLLSELIKKGAAIILQELLEQEVTEFLGRGHYERQKKSVAFRIVICQKEAGGIFKPGRE